MDIDAYSATLTGMQLERRRKTSPALLEDQNKCPDFGKKSPNCAHHCIKFSIQNVVLRASKRKKPCDRALSSHIETHPESLNIQNPFVIASRHKFRTLSYLTNLKPDAYSETISKI